MVSSLSMHVSLGFLFKPRFFLARFLDNLVKLILKQLKLLLQVLILQLVVRMLILHDLHLVIQLQHAIQVFVHFNVLFQLVTQTHSLQVGFQLLPHWLFLNRWTVTTRTYLMLAPFNY